MRASDAMTSPHYDVHPDHPLTEAIERMRRDRTEVLPVVDGDEMVGLLTLADASGDTTVWDIDPAKAAVRDVMQAEFVWCFEDEQLDRAAASLRDAGQKHGVVLNRDHELVGLIAADRLDGASATSSPTSEHEIVHRRARGRQFRRWPRPAQRLQRASARAPAHLHS